MLWRTNRLYIVHDDKTALIASISRQIMFYYRGLRPVAYLNSAKYNKNSCQWMRSKMKQQIT